MRIGKLGTISDRVGIEREILGEALYGILRAEVVREPPVVTPSSAAILRSVARSKPRDAMTSAAAWAIAARRSS
jgi:hypothetical protein